MIIMADKILIAYASRTGATKDTAQVIAKILTESGLLVDVLPVESLNDLASYQAVVVGSAIQDRQWLPEAVTFIQRYRAALNQKPFAMFTLCMTLAMKNGEKYRSDVQAWLDPVRRQVQPVSEGLFAGVLDIAKIPSLGARLKFRLSVLFGVWSEGDHRDMEAITIWAQKLSLKLK
jgi:menaquinone-dependent protoporphyrinogen oxidase